MTGRIVQHHPKEKERAALEATLSQLQNDYVLNLEDITAVSKQMYDIKSALKADAIDHPLYAYLQDKMNDLSQKQVHLYARMQHTNARLAELPKHYQRRRAAYPKRVHRKYHNYVPIACEACGGMHKMQDCPMWS